ncbi:hypothetical protein ACFSHR_10940 [Azotobacter chroococcum]
MNVDAVIAALLLKMVWQPMARGEINEQELETAAFTIFLYPRMLGCAAEIDDHINRGKTWILERLQAAAVSLYRY